MRGVAIIILLLIQTKLSFAQLLNDAESKQSIIKGLDKLYNFEFKEADVFFQKVKSKYPAHPVTPLLNAFQLQWQNIPVEKNPKALQSYLHNLEKCREIAEKLYQEPQKKPEAAFFLLASHGYIALTYNHSKDFMKAANEARKAFGYVKDGFAFMEKNPDFYFTTGLYNFYIEQYPETHPIVKPLMMFFEDGNKKLGLHQLEIASQKSSFSRIESLWYLTSINLKYESNPIKSLHYSKILKENYPNNILFMMRYTEGLVFSGKIEEAQIQISNLRKNKNAVYQIASTVFEGIIFEKYKKNDAAALENYQAAIKLTSNDYADDYIAMAYAGMARIAHRSGNRKRAKLLYEKCLETAEYSSTIKEAKAYK